MRPDARVQAASEILDQVFEGVKPLDSLNSEYFKKRRYAGSKDRRAISERVYRIIRKRALISWICDQVDLTFCARTACLVDAALNDTDPESLFSGLKFAPEPLAPSEKEALSRIKTLAKTDLPDWVVHEYPQWLETELIDSLGSDLGAVMASLNEKAPLDLRINRLHPHADQAFESLTPEIEDLQTTPFSPMGLRSHSALKINGLKAYKDGLIEIQDESAQIASLLCQAGGQDVVIDFCAGAGGKTLAIGAEMNNQGTLYALDISQRRLYKMRPRLMRAGLKNVILQPIKNEQDPWLKQFEGRADRVLIDAPCSGTGTWRRQPESRWKLSLDQLNDFKGRQERLLKQAAYLVKPGGRILYATCSLLKSENRHQVTRFLDNHANFSLMPIPEIWAQVATTPAVPSGDFLELRPDVQGCDGFFACVLKKSDL